MRPRGKILIFGDDSGAIGQGVVPDLAVRGFTQPYLPYGLRIVSGLAPPAGKRWRQLGVNEKSHALATNTR